MGNTRTITKSYNKIEAERTVFTKLDAQLEAGTFTDVNRRTDLKALDQ